MFENWHGINPMGLSDSLEENKKYLTNMKMSPKFLKWNKKIQGIDPMDPCDPWSNSFIKNQFFIKTWTKRNEFLLKIFRSLTK